MHLFLWDFTWLFGYMMLWGQDRDCFGEIKGYKYSVILQNLNVTRLQFSSFKHVCVCLCVCKK